VSREAASQRFRQRIEDAKRALVDPDGSRDARWEAQQEIQCVIAEALVELIEYQEAAVG
jgi:hypothetical protein